MPTRRILLIDDEPHIREVAEVSLEAVGGLDVEVAGSGAEGIEKAAEWRPAAILLDVMMPGLDGPSTLERLRAGEATRDIPVVFLTAKAQAAEQRRLLDMGVAGVITKPFDPMTLADRVSEALGAPA